MKVVEIIKRHSKVTICIFDFLSQYWYLDALYEDKSLFPVYKEARNEAYMRMAYNYKFQ